MSSEERRNELINILEASREPIKGSKLAEEMNVSRQVIVQDIALIRAKGYQIIATPQGYIIYEKKSIKEQIKCKNHIDDKSIYDELKIIVDLGGYVNNVIVNHPIYGNIEAELNISTQRDILNFMNKVKNNEFKQLSSLSTCDHIHTIEAPTIEIMEEIMKELKEQNILS